MTISVGWWLLPLGITIAAFIWANAFQRESRSGQMFSGVGDALEGMFRGGIAAILSLLTWLVWALLR